jgi:hypothetical protein
MFAAIMALGSGCGGVVNSRADAGDVPGTDAASDAAFLDSGSDAVPHDAAAAPMTVKLTAGGSTLVLGVNGDEFVDSCATGQALTGFTGANGLYATSVVVVGELVGHCRSLHVGVAAGSGYLVTSTVGVALPPRGADTADRWTLDCPTDQVVVGIAVRDGSALDQLALQCAPVGLITSDAGWVGKLDTVTTGDAVGGTGGLAAMALCPAGQIATTSHARVIAVKAVIGGLGLGCSAVAGN